MKKRGMILLSILLVFTLLAGCTAESGQAPTTAPTATPTITVNVAGLKGPTGIGMVKLMDNNAQELTKNKYNFELVGSPENIVAKISSGEADIAAVPINLASTLYNKTEGNVQILALNTLGVLSVISPEGTTLKDRENATLYATGKGATPEFILNFIIQNNAQELGKFKAVEYVTEHSELAAKIVAGEVQYALLPEPFVTAVMMSEKIGEKDNNLQTQNVTKLWEKACENAGIQDRELAQGCIIVRKEFTEQHPELVKTFMEEYQASTEFANANIDETAELVVKFELMPNANIAKAAIPRCNIVYIDGEPMKKAAANVLKVFFDANPQSVGGKLPEDDFYYAK